MTELALKTKELGQRFLMALAKSMDHDLDFFLSCHQRVLGAGNWSKIR